MSKVLFQKNVQRDDVKKTNLQVVGNPTQKTVCEPTPNLQVFGIPTTLQVVGIPNPNSQVIGMPMTILGDQSSNLLLVPMQMPGLQLVNVLSPIPQIVNVQSLNQENYQILEKPKTKKEFKCKFCQMTLQTKIFLKFHEETHVGENRCQKCLEQFYNRSCLKVHVSSHNCELQFKCELCVKRFAREDNRDGHVRLHQENKLQHQCDKCATCFHNQGYLNYHKGIKKEEKNFECKTCGKVFTSNENLEVHIRSHTGEKPFMCDRCGRCFSHSNTMKVHRRIHLKEKPHKCTLCGKSFIRRIQLNDHLRTHTGEKPLQCGKCGKSFSRRTVFMTHLRTHTGEKPYQCKFCGKRFNSSGNRSKHLWIHKDKRSYDKRLTDLII